MADRPATLRPTADVLPADRLRNLVDRACRHLTPAEANALRGALAGTVRNATTAVEGLHQRAAEAEDDRDRARRWAVHLENENRRLEDQTRDAKERARVAVVAAYNLKRQTPDAAQRTLDRVRQARTWCDLWVQLGQYYGLKPEQCGLEARDRRTTAERIAEERAAELGKRLRTARDGVADREVLLTEARDALEDADAGGHGDDWPHLAPGIRALLARAERAEQQAANVRAYADRLHDGDPAICDSDVRRTLLAALGAAGQPDTSEAG